MDNETKFLVCNLPELLQKQMSSLKEDLKTNMNEENFSGYDYATFILLGMLRSLVYTTQMDGKILVYTDRLCDDIDSQEYDLEDLLNFFDSRIVVQKNTSKESNYGM